MVATPCVHTHACIHLFVHTLKCVHIHVCTYEYVFHHPLVSASLLVCVHTAWLRLVGSLKL